MELTEARCFELSFYEDRKVDKYTDMWATNHLKNGQNMVDSYLFNQLGSICGFWLYCYFLLDTVKKQHCGR